MRYFMIVMSVVIVVTFLLAILAGSAHAGETPPAPVREAQPEDATPLAFLALASGAGLLAGIVWLGTLRRMPK